VDIKGWQNSGGGHGKTLKPHQWQTIHHLYRQGTGISALGTGFGKTASAVGLMSLLRQEGKLSRVWLQVPNNKVKDWIAEIKDVMPHLKTASIDTEEPGYGNRDKRYARYWQIANSKADVIIMPESAASEIQLKKDNDALVRDKIADDYKTEIKRGGASERQTVKAELKGLADTQNGKTNSVINFEDFGCDAVFVDEAHNYKNLFSSSLSRETGMNDGRQSAKAMSLFKKADFIRENNNGKNVFLLTATPLTNSPLEYYNMLQYIASDELKRFGILSIDGFIREFADVKEGMRYDWTKNKAGWGKILTGFKNLQTLQDLFFKYTDLQNDPDAVGIEKPEPRNMPNIIPSDDSQTTVLKSISAEIERYRKMDKEEREAEYPGQNFLTFYSQMRTASLDLELFDPDAYKNWKNPKLEKLTENVKNIYDNTKGGQVIFCDRIFDSDSAFNLHDKIKASLAQRGFKDDEIIIINGFTKSGDKRSDSAVEKDVSKAIDGYNSGKYKVIIGTTACIGEGVNLQKNSSEAQKTLLKLSTNVDAFYAFPDKDLVRDYYKYHLASFSNWNPDRRSEPPVFTIAGDGKLVIGYTRYSVDDDTGFVNALNPFLAEDRESITAAAQRGVTFEYSKYDALYSLTKKHFPDLHKALIPHFKTLDIENINRDIINDYRLKGFASVSNSVLRNKNIIHKENKIMESNENLNEQAASPVEQSVKKTWKEREADLKQNFSPEVASDPAAKYHALHSATEWRTDKGEHRLYFNFTAKKHLYGLSTYGKQELSPEKSAEYQTRFNSTKLIDFPEKAFQNGKPLSPEKAFEILYSNPYYDMNQKKLIGLLPDVQTRADYLKQRSLDMGGKEYVNEEKGMHRIYFQTPTAIKNLYGIETQGKTDLSPEQLAEQQAKFPYVKFLPNMPESANLRGEPIEPQRAFDMLASRPYFDVKSGKFELFSKEDTFDMFVNKEFNKKDVTETRRAELLVIAAKHDRQIKDTVNEAAVFAAKMNMELSAKDMNPAQQLKVFLQSAVENNNVPWEKEFGASTAFAPHNSDTGNVFAKTNLIAASLHMAHIGSNDPRYLTEDKIQKYGLMTDENAVPLKIAYRTKAKDGTYQNKITSYFNAKDVAGMPPLTLPKSINELSPPLTPDRSANPTEQISANMAGFIAALSSNRGFQPASSGINQEDYKNFSALPVNDLFAKIHGASVKAAELSQEPMEQQLEHGRQAAGMEM
jgi:thymidylate kinase